MTTITTSPSRLSRTWLWGAVAVGSLAAALILTWWVSIRPTSFSSPVLKQLQGTAQLPGLPMLGVQPEDVPDSFADLTIPALRARQYSSQLGELEQVSQTSTYTSYRTSYDSDGLTVYAQLTVPKGEAPATGWPAVIFIHGYIPPTTYRTFSNYASYVDYLASRGLAVFKIDLRGHGESEGDPGGAYYSSDYIVDALNAYAALQRSDMIDPARIGVWGHSMAGNVTLRTLAAKPDIPAAVIWAGAGYTYQDLRELGIDDNSYRPPASTAPRTQRRQELFAAHGQFSADSPFWQQVAPTNYLNDLQGAVQLHHAVDDNVVNIEYSRNLNSLLDQTEVTHELHEYQNGGHNISGSSFSQAMARTVSFFQDHL